MRHAKILAAVILSVSTFGLAQAHEQQGIVVGEPMIDAVPELPPAAVAGEIPGGLTDSAWKMAYVVGDNGHTEAVDLKTGATKFASATPAIPLVAQGDLLYVLTCKVDPSAQLAEVVVRGMSVSGQGKYTFESKKIPVPEWLTTSYGSSMVATAKIEGGKLMLSWQANMDPYTALTGQALIQIAQRQQWAQAQGPGIDEANQGVMLSEIDLKTGDVKAIEKKAEDGQAQPAANAGEEEDFPQAVNAEKAASGATLTTSATAAQTRVMRDGNIYSIAAKSGETQMNCQRIEDRRLLWVHPISPTRVLKTDLMAPEKPPVMPNFNRMHGLRCGLDLGC